MWPACRPDQADCYAWRKKGDWADWYCKLCWAWVADTHLGCEKHIDRAKQYDAGMWAPDFEPGEAEKRGLVPQFALADAPQPPASSSWLPSELPSDAERITKLVADQARALQILETNTAEKSAQIAKLEKRVAALEEELDNWWNWNWWTSVSTDGNAASCSGYHQ